MYRRRWYAMFVGFLIGMLVFFCSVHTNDASLCCIVGVGGLWRRQVNKFQCSASLFVYAVAINGVFGAHKNGCLAETWALAMF